ncbi:hypothetical protein [Bradyrhizobium roseum]|uniref:hypothetical protein n=1 Tax=Bradyrhizobium roseum TaxID=3056648 RepID=UPI00260CBF63|nr:hypothetical protein [Bradyrhizobium roseus]WKA31587.1 hypothetical protein QUH67_16130 [Bradyrhizobium roseus]
MGRRFTIGFDDETADQVRALAAADRVSFAEKARQLVEWGLEAVKEEGQPGATARSQNR